ncbi:MAG: 2-C-methyl-D-erythritol 4-phosphate cytidylyltransferase [Chitinophagaceae bacterium]|nr:2-C-methyl-D-erythritol 4-phosphate cytidylyltransferase [Chitinophagaceae bacterium]
MKKFAVIVAGGSGTRMGSKVPKQFLLLNGQPVLLYTVEAFLSAYPDMEVILVLPSSYMEQGAEIARQSSDSARISITTGGETRFHSVRKGLSLATHPSIILVHDGVRCLVTQKLIRSCYEQAVEKGSAIPCIAVPDSIRIINGDKHQSVDRAKLRAIQTPQTFQSEMLLKSFELPYSERFTDEATVVEAAGYEVFLAAGEKENIKITLPADIPVAEQVLKARSTL